MPTWLDMVRMEVENMDPCTVKEPTSQEVDPVCDTLLTVVDDVDLQKLFCLAIQREKTAAELEVRARFETDYSEQKRLMIEHTQMSSEARVLMEVMMISLRNTYDLWDKGKIHFCQGWKLVQCNGGRPDIRKIFDGLFDGGR